MKKYFLLAAISTLLVFSTISCENEDVSYCGMLIINDTATEKKFYIYINNIQLDIPGTGDRVVTLEANTGWVRYIPPNNTGFIYRIEKYPVATPAENYWTGSVSADEKKELRFSEKEYYFKIKKR